MSESNILVLEGYDASPLGSHGSPIRLHHDPFAKQVTARRREAIDWNACKVGRKVIVYPNSYSRTGSVSAPSVECQNNTRFHVFAATKKEAKKLAVQKFRAEKKERKAARLGGFSGPQSAAQRRFAAAAHACRVEVGSGGKNRSYLGCMKRKLTK